jgi:hypothetical protein
MTTYCKSLWLWSSKVKSKLQYIYTSVVKASFGILRLFTTICWVTRVSFDPFSSILIYHTSWTFWNQTLHHLNFGYNFWPKIPRIAFRKLFGRSRLSWVVVGKVGTCFQNSSRVQRDSIHKSWPAINFWFNFWKIMQLS